VRTKLRRQYVKLCDPRDFEDRGVERRIDAIVPGLEPQAHPNRKLWEYAMLTLFLEDSDLLREDTRILSVGAGHETVLFWLANHVEMVWATDVYGEGSFGEREADSLMLTDPAAFSPYPYRESHLEVRHMDARELRFPDESFDAVFSLSSIEHFGTWASIRRASQEIGRVLRPGGRAFVATECFVGRSTLAPFVQEAASRLTGRRMFGAMRVFTPRTLASEIVQPSGLQLLQPLDLTLSPAANRSVSELNSAGQLTATNGPYSNVIVRATRSLGPLAVHTQKWTSVGLAMGKSLSWTSQDGR
jgi:SAM-dependent methyltransferase